MSISSGFISRAEAITWASAFRVMVGRAQTQLAVDSAPSPNREVSTSCLTPSIGTLTGRGFSPAVSGLDMYNCFPSPVTSKVQAVPGRENGQTPIDVSSARHFPSRFTLILVPGPAVIPSAYRVLPMTSGMATLPRIFRPPADAGPSAVHCKSVSRRYGGFTARAIDF